jgi:sRNA-binding carbon storage regulator CsrA
MNRVFLKVDQPLAIGRDIRIWLTDIDPKGVRMISTGRLLGGPHDGETFEKAHELTVGASVNLGPQVLVTLAAVRGDTARLDVFTPVHISVQSDG